MDINRANMEALFKSFNTKFTEGMTRGIRPDGDAAAEYLTLADLAMTVPSTGAVEVHAWLNQIPGFRQWLGDRIKKNISSNKLEVTNLDWEDTISVPRNDIEDDRYGVYSPLMSMMGQEASDDALWLDMAVDALIANGEWVDGKAFFHATRTYGSQTIANLVTGALATGTLETALSTMMAYKGPENNPLNVTPVYLLVGPSLRDTAWDLLVNQFVSSGTGKGGAVQNRTKGRAIMKVHPKLTGAYANYWYLLGAKGGMKPVAVQRRKLAQLVAKDSVTDDNVFFNKEFVYGADARGAGFLTLPHMAYCGTGAG